MVSIPPGDMDSYHAESDIESARSARGSQQETKGPSDIAYRSMIDELEKAPLVSHLDALARRGILPKDPDELDDQSLSSQLHLIIEALASRNTFLVHTDHMSDRELYIVLCSDVLRQRMPDVSRDGHIRELIDMIGASGQKQLDLYLKHYAGPSERRWWSRARGHIPDHVDPPYDRDRFLPGSDQ